MSLSWTIDISNIIIPGNCSMGAVEKLLWSGGMVELASCVLGGDVAYSAHVICLAKQPSLAGYTSSTDGLNCDV